MERGYTNEIDELLDEMEEYFTKITKSILSTLSSASSNQEKGHAAYKTCFASFTYFFDLQDSYAWLNLMVQGWKLQMTQTSRSSTFLIW